MGKRSKRRKAKSRHHAQESIHRIAKHNDIRETIHSLTKPMEAQTETPPSSITTSPAPEKAEEKVTKSILQSMPHCGQMLINNEVITGWFYPISISLWTAIVGFHHAVSCRTKGESVSYHRFNQQTQEYDTIIPYQRTRGLAVSTDWQDPRNINLLDEYARSHGIEFFPACTIHTHVDVAAFESGTDAGDEKDLPGWHITIGKLLTFPKIDLHCRFRLPKIPSIRKLTSTSGSYDLKICQLFEKGMDLRDVVEPDKTNEQFHQFIDRVSLR